MNVCMYLYHHHSKHRNKLDVMEGSVVADMKKNKHLDNLNLFRERIF